MAPAPAAKNPEEPPMYPETTTAPAVVIVHRTAAAAAAAGNTYTARAECAAGNGCRYASRWSHEWKAEEAASAHTCNR